jgi:hypothetical protein
MASNFPVDFDVFATLADNVDTIHASNWIDLSNAIIAIENAIGANLSLLRTTGEIRLWSGSIESIPSGYLHCDGSAVSRNTFANLFSAIGSTYGSGNGTSTFNLPNSADIFLIGANQDDTGVAKTMLEGVLGKTGGSILQPPRVTNKDIDASVTAGPNQNIGGHDHSFTPPFLALVYMVKT